jgi:hypothetical protein
MNKFFAACLAAAAIACLPGCATSTPDANPGVVHHTDPNQGFLDRANTQLDNDDKGVAPFSAPPPMDNPASAKIIPPN